MGLKLTQVTDPRDPLERVRRKPLENYIRVHHPEMYQHNMPATVMRMLLKAKGVTDIKDIPAHSMGDTEQETQEVDAEALALAEWKMKQRMGRNGKLPMSELRKAVKAKGIAAPRTSKREDLERMLNGKDTAERRQ